MRHKIKVAVLFGGRSSEHDISVLSAAAVMPNIPPADYEILPIGIDRNGAWFLGSPDTVIAAAACPQDFFAAARQVAFMGVGQGEAYLIDGKSGTKISRLELIFPVLHGPYGEDGTIQGLARFYDLPCVGCGVLGSALAMDKEAAKRLLRQNGLKVTDFVCLRRGLLPANLPELIAPLGWPLFVKPANMGSSIGISRVNNKTDLDKAVKLAFNYDDKILIEEAVAGRELECAVLGNMNPVASCLGEIKVKEAGAFYSYDKKYKDERGTELLIPAAVDPTISAKARAMALTAFMALNLNGLSRVDFFLNRHNELIINEINTMPGFTRFSMYPKLWKQSGITYPHLIGKLLQLALA